MRRRSNLMVVLGVAFFVVGAAIVFLVAKDDDDGVGGSAAANRASVLVAKEDLASGQEGDSLFDKVELKEVRLVDRAADALTSPGQLSNHLLLRGFVKGEQIVQSGLRVQSLLAQTAPIPEGFEAVAITTDFTAGGAGYVAPGDLVNLFAVFPLTKPIEGSPDLAYTTPRVEMMLTNVMVLDVQTEVAPYRSTATTGEQAAVGTSARPAASGSLTVLLAVKAVDAEKVIFAATQASTYLSLVGENNPPVDATTGRDHYNVLEEEPGVAYQRSGPA